MKARILDRVMTTQKRQQQLINLLGLLVLNPVPAVFQHVLLQAWHAFGHLFEGVSLQGADRVHVAE